MTFIPINLLLAECLSIDSYTEGYHGKVTDDFPKHTNIIIVGVGGYWSDNHPW